MAEYLTYRIFLTCSWMLFCCVNANERKLILCDIYSFSPFLPLRIILKNIETPRKKIELLQALILSTHVEGSFSALLTTQCVFTPCAVLSSACFLPAFTLRIARLIRPCSHRSHRSIWTPERMNTSAQQLRNGATLKRNETSRTIRTINVQFSRGYSLLALLFACRRQRATARAQCMNLVLAILHTSNLRE